MNKFSIQAKTLLNALTYVGRVIDSKPIVPVLENVKATITGTTCVLTASNSAITLCRQIEVESEGDESFTFLIPYQKVSGLLATFSGVVVMWPTDHHLTISAPDNNFSATLVSENPQYFPAYTPPVTDDELKIDLAGEDRFLLEEALLAAQAVASSDTMRWDKNGVNLRVAPYNDIFGLWVIGVDGTRCVRHMVMEMPETGKEQSFYLPLPLVKAMLSQLAMTLNEGDGLCSLLFSKRSLKSICGAFTLEGLLSDNLFMDVSFAFKQPYLFPAYLPKTSLLSFLKRARIVNEQPDAILRFVLYGTVTISVNHPNIEHRASELIEGSSYDGVPMEIGIQARLLEPMLTHTSGETIALGVTAPEKPIWILGDNLNASAIIGSSLLNHQPHGA
jgi:DNA polymerase III sliding clamp (beta) subunit (PCNA family)